MADLRLLLEQDSQASSITPTFGPVSGGTKVTVLGANLLTGSEVNVTVGGQPCDLVSKECKDTRLVCVTAPWQQIPTTVVVSVVIDAYNHSTFNFTYKPDPTISEVSPRKTILRLVLTKCT